MGAFCSCFTVHERDAEVSPSSSSSSSSSQDSNTRNQNQHATTRIVSFFNRCNLIIRPMRVRVLEDEAATVQSPEAANDSPCTPTDSILPLSQGITWKPASPDSDTSEECPTCFESYTYDNPKIIGECSHHFHLQCILEWQKISEECPNCRRVLVVRDFFG